MSTMALKARVGVTKSPKQAPEAPQKDLCPPKIIKNIFSKFSNVESHFTWVESHLPKNFHATLNLYFVIFDCSGYVSVKINNCHKLTFTLSGLLKKS